MVIGFPFVTHLPLKVIDEVAANPSCSWGQFVGANHLEVNKSSGTAQEKSGSKKLIAFKKAIFAAGSQGVRLPFMQKDGVDKGLSMVGSTGALELKEVPKPTLIMGGGIIGLEMRTI